MKLRLRIIAGSLCVLAVAVLCLAYYVDGDDRSVFYASASVIREPTLIIDPGHGGFDGGAVAADGTMEKELNLKLAKQLNELSSALGYKTVMVRETDRSTDSDGEQSGSKKVKDIKNRLSLMKKYGDCTFVSIHMNKYSTSQPHGTQVFYAPTEGSDVLAEAIQASVATMLQTDNKRVIKPAGRDIYLMHNATAVAVLVECGFLSNKNDLKNLKDDIYRRDLAFSILCGIIASGK